MLGLVDFIRAVVGTVRLSLRRIHPLAGPVAVAVVWLLALGSLLWVTREDASSAPSSDAAAETERSGDGTGDQGGSPSSSDRDGRDGPGWETSTRRDASLDGDDGDTADGDTASGSDGDGASVLESPGGGRIDPPSTGPTSPSWDPDEPVGTSSTTTSPTTPGTSGSTTSTTTPPDPGNGGGVLGGLLDLLFP